MVQWNRIYDYTTEELIEVNLKNPQRTRVYVTRSMFDRLLARCGMDG